MQTIWQDVRFGVRMLVKHWIATIVCVIALGLGIGANTAMFSLAEAFLLHPVPFENSDRIVALVDSRAASQDGGAGFGPQDLNPVAPATYLDWKKEARSFDELAAYAWDELNLTGDREAQKVQDFQVSANFFPMIGVQPLLGRTFLPEEEESGRNQEIILSCGLWEQRYGSDPNVLKRVIKVDGKSFNIVGVMKKGFDFPMPAEAWIPLALNVKERLRRDNRWLWVLGRLKPGGSSSAPIIGRPQDDIASYLYGQNPFLREYADKNKVPVLGALGGAETMYPEFPAKVRDARAADAAANAKLFPSGPSRASRAVDPDPHDGEIHVLPVQGNLYMLVGDGGNIAVQVGDEGPLVVDTGAGQLSDKVIAAIRKLSERPIQFILNTSFHPDHTGGNVKLQKAGHDASVVGSFFSNQFADAGQGATVIGHQNVQDRLSALTGAAAMPAVGWHSDTFLSGRRRKHHNGEAVEIFHQPNAITDGDSIVHFRRSDVIATGDIFSTTSYPFIDSKNGGSLQGEIRALNFILDRTVYDHDEEGGTLIIPGRGRLCDEWEVA